MMLFIFVAYCLKIVVSLAKVNCAITNPVFTNFLLIIDFQGACVVEIVKGPELVSLDSKKFQAHKVMNLRKLIQLEV